MKDSVLAYELASSGSRASIFKLQPDPAFRLGKQGDGVVLEGAIFLWADEIGRPTAAAQVFLIESADRRQGAMAARVYLAGDPIAQGHRRRPAALAAGGCGRRVPADPGAPQAC